MALLSPRLVLLLPLSLTACEDRVGQCNQLVERLNPHTDAMIRSVEGLTGVESEPHRVEAWLEAIDAADRDLSEFTIEDERLAGFALRYRRQLADARKAAETMRAATQTLDPEALHRAAKQADAFLEAQAKILAEFNEYCAPVD